MIQLPDDNDEQKNEEPTVNKDALDPKKANSPLPPVDPDLIIELPAAPPASGPEGE